MQTTPTKANPPNSSFSSQRGSLGANLPLSLQNQAKKLPPQPYKFSLPSQALNVGIGQMYQQHLNTRYGMQHNTRSQDENSKSVGADQHQEAGGEDSYAGRKQPVMGQSPASSGQFATSSFTLNNSRRESNANLKTSSRYQEHNNENF